MLHNILIAAGLVGTLVVELSSTLYHTRVRNVNCQAFNIFVAGLFNLSNQISSIRGKYICE